MKQKVLRMIHHLFWKQLFLKVLTSYIQRIISQNKRQKRRKG